MHLLYGSPSAMAEPLPTEELYPLSLLAFKHRDLTPLPKDIELPRGNAWYIGDTRAAKYSALADKYPGYTVYQADLTTINEWSIMPAKAFVTGEFLGRKFGFNLEYKTISCSGRAKRPPCPKGFTMVNMQEINVSPTSLNYASLDKKVWCQGQSDGLRVLIQLELYTTYPGILMQDDATGEVYCYRPCRILVLVPKVTQESSV